MSTVKKIMFILILSVAVGASVWFSFNAISRATYEYSLQTDIGGTGIEGLVFEGFNGNPETKEVRVYHPMVKNEDKENSGDATYSEDKTKTVAGIDKFTFVSDENMEICYVGPDVIYIDDQAFFGCFALKAIIVDEKNTRYTDIDGVLYTKDMKEIILYPTNHINYMKETGKVAEDYYDNNDEIYEIPDGVEKISSGCFYKVWGIKKITLPDSLREIGDMAFFKCESLELIRLPEKLELIGNDSFSYCKSMKYALFIPKSVKQIGHHCFYKSDNLKLFFFEHASEDEIILGGRWQPKNDNKFTSPDPVFSATMADVQQYNAEAAKEDGK